MVNPWCYRFPCWFPCVPKVQWMHVKPGAKLSSLVADPPVFELLPVRTQAWVRYRCTSEYPYHVGLLSPSRVVWEHREYARCKPLQRPFAHALTASVTLLGIGNPDSKTLLRWRLALAWMHRRSSLTCALFATLPHVVRRTCGATQETDRRE